MAKIIEPPKLNLSLSCGPLYLLSTPCSFRINLVCELESKEPVSISSKGSIFHPSALSNGSIRVVDSETGEALDFGSTVQSKESPANDIILTLNPGQSKMFTWTNDVEEENTSTFFLPIKISNVKPGRRYLVQYKHHGITKWFRHAEGPINFLTSLGEDPQIIMVSIKCPTHTAFNTLMEPPRGPPLEASLSTSCPQLNLSGDPPFTTFVSLKLVGYRRICILLNLDCSKCMGILVHESGSRKRRAPQWDQYFESDPDEPTPEQDTPEFRYGLSDPMVLRIGSGDIARMSCTFMTEDRQDGFTRSDTHYLKSDHTYIMGLRPRKCRWAYEDALPRSDLTDQQLKELLELMPESRLNSDCSLDLKVVGQHPEQRGRRDYALVGFEFLRAEN
jgi:hypothetical protein